jgi:hypothetical protein
MRLIYGPEMPAPTAKARFWDLVPPRVYLPAEAQELLGLYLDSVERELSDRLSKHSIAYWYHVYRRLGMGAIGPTSNPVTVMHTRAIFDAAIQKYAKATLCDRLVPTGPVPLDSVFAGEPKGIERELIEVALSGKPSLFLTNFTVTELYELYQIERLAYEIWATTALYRITGKGAPLEVLSGPPYLMDYRSPELAELVDHYDRRNLANIADGTFETNSGTVFRNQIDSGVGLFTQTNIMGNEWSFAIEWLAQQGVAVHQTGPLNFVVFPINLRNFLSSHRPFEEAFERMHGFSIEECLVVFAAIGWMRVQIANDIDRHEILRCEKRGYSGAFSMDRIEFWVRESLPTFAKSLGCKRDVSNFRVTEVLDWLTLTEDKRREISLGYAGPHSVFLPVTHGDSTDIFVDFAWLFRRLRDLFFDVRIDDNNFKGTALEEVTRSETTPLTHKQLVATDGTSKQIDASFARGSRLFVVECRAFQRSIGFEKGQIKATLYARERIERALRDIDAKAAWLASRPIGRNYDVSGFTEIVPLCVVPFAEFIPSLFEWYWLRKGVSRVLRPDELKAELTRTNDDEVYFNSVRVNNAAADDQRLN